MIFKVVKTPCYPNEWYAGPVDISGFPLDTATCNYYASEEDARTALIKMRVNYMKSLQEKYWKR